MESKKQLALELTALFHGLEQGQKEAEAFPGFSRGQDPDDMPRFP